MGNCTCKQSNKNSNLGELHQGEVPVPVNQEEVKRVKIKLYRQIIRESKQSNL
jgi:hypothetical protein